METPENMLYCKQKLTELTAFGGKAPSLWLLPPEERTLKHASNIPAFWKTARGTAFHPTWLTVLTELAYTSHLGTTGNKKELSGFWQPQRKSRDNKPLKMKEANLSNWGVTCTCPEIAYLQKRWSGSQNLYPHWLMKFFSLYDASL